MNIIIIIIVSSCFDCSFMDTIKLLQAQETAALVASQTITAPQTQSLRQLWSLLTAAGRNWPSGKLRYIYPPTVYQILVRNLMFYRPCIIV